MSKHVDDFDKDPSAWANIIDENYPRGWSKENKNFCCGKIYTEWQYSLSKRKTSKRRTTPSDD